MINHYRNEENSGAEGNINYSLKDSKSFDYKASIVESITDTDLTKETVKIVAPLKHLSNFWRTLNIPLIKYEISLTLTWSRNRVLISKTTVLEIYADPILPKIDILTNATFQITETKLYVLTVNLSTQDDKKLLEERTIKWIKIQSRND